MAATPLVRPKTSTGVRRRVLGFPPRRSLALSPQHLAPPPVVRAQVWLPPAAMAATPLVRPKTSTGVRRCVAELSPSWPLKLSPQHLTLPPVVRAQVWSMPAAMAATPLVRPKTSTGVRRRVVELSPSWPLELSHQHRAPWGERAQVWSPAAAMAATPLVRPKTSAGVKRCVVELSPSWPLELSPQHLTPPPVVRAQVWSTLAAMAATPLVRPKTAAG